MMNLKVKRINWVGNIYQKFEQVCQEVDGIVSQDAVKYFENRVQNVGDSVKKLYSEVVHELIPFPTLASPTKYEAHSFSLKNNVGSRIMSVPDVEDKDENKNGVEENPLNNFIESLQDSNAIDLADDQQAGAPDKHELVNQVSSETCLDSPEKEDSFITQEEVSNESREISVVEKNNLHPSIEDTAIKSASELINLVSLKTKEPLEFSKSYSASSDSACGVSVRTKVNVEQDPCLIVEENNMNSSTAEVLNFMSVGETELIKASLFDESSVVDKNDTDMLAEVLPAVSSASCKRPITKPDSSMVHVCCDSPQVAGQVKESHDGIVSSCQCQSMQSNDESCSVELSLEDIQLNNDRKLEERCMFVNDRELYAVSSRIQKLRSYKKRIQDAFASKKRLAKEYEQLAIWYGDADMEPSQDSSQTRLPFSSRTYANSKNLQVQQASETEWELL